MNRGNEMEKCLPTDIADALITRLASDDAFRETFRRDPRRALAELGFEPARLDVESSDGIAKAVDGPWNCLHGDGLPGKDEIARIRDTLRAQLVGQMNHQVFHVKLR